ncbi:TetR/AcrR family transcriptional regulator [Microbacterium sp. cx-55]|uniref:TetR/AcrR family transcriptional regulator n=1 Tax=Microbacterium sp. cx-55 TaxID=2875948 RepID=UPI001CBC4C85|nr:TetR/AcrR family transcriptional regulator [Microbacterium sp. cx-55]MBZ4486705.1 TetR/AcrR family transcriptional regulator [Microbacterium sp. cx-55]UGB36335.1 TetR/AcrR family transcriptional regulator [Microbacterium sp. cx-55]
MSRHKEFNPADALEQAMLVFWDHGFEGSSTAELSTRMGIGKRSMYDTFGDKRQLYVAALRRYIDSTDAARDHAVSVATSLNEALSALLAPPPGNDAHPRGCFATAAAAATPADDAEIGAILDGHMARGRARIAAQICRFTATPKSRAVEIAHFAQDAATGLRVRARAGLTQPGDVTRLVTVVNTLATAA